MALQKQEGAKLKKAGSDVELACTVTRYVAAKSEYHVIFMGEAYTFQLDRSSDRPYIRQQYVAGFLIKKNKVRKQLAGYSKFKGEAWLRILPEQRYRSLLNYTEQDELYIQRFYRPSPKLAGNWIVYRVKFIKLAHYPSNAVIGEIIEIIGHTDEQVVGNEIKGTFKNCFIIVDGERRYFNTRALPEPEPEIINPAIPRPVNWTSLNLADWEPGTTFYYMLYVPIRHDRNLDTNTSSFRIEVYHLKLLNKMDIVPGGTIFRARIKRCEQQPERKFTNAIMTVIQHRCFLWGNPDGGKPRACWLTKGGFAE